MANELELLKIFCVAAESDSFKQAAMTLGSRAKQLIQEMESLLRVPATEDDGKMSGQISLTLPASLGRRFVMPALISFRQQYPDVTIRCVFTDTHSDVIDSQIDIGLRTGFLRDNRFVARKVLDFNFYLVGAPELIQRVGVPATLEHLNTLPVVALLDIYRASLRMLFHLPS